MHTYINIHTYKHTYTYTCLHKETERSTAVRLLPPPPQRAYIEMLYYSNTSFVISDLPLSPFLCWFHPDQWLSWDDVRETDRHPAVVMITVCHPVLSSKTASTRSIPRRRRATSAPMLCRHVTFPSFRRSEPKKRHLARKTIAILGQLLDRYRKRVFTAADYNDRFAQLTSSITGTAKRPAKYRDSCLTTRSKTGRQGRVTGSIRHI